VPVPRPDRARKRGDAGLLQFPATDDLKKVEQEGAAWASQCTKGLFTEKDLVFFATRYRPFFEYLKEVEGLFQATLVEFDPFAQHEHCRMLFAPAFGSHGAMMVSPATNPLGRVPDFRFAAFEAGVIREIRRRWETQKKKGSTS
jgi:hypothetical protein